MAQNNTQDPSGTDSNRSVNSTTILLSVGVFLLAALVTMVAVFWYAGHHALSAVPQQGPTGVGGNTAGTKGH